MNAERIHAGIALALNQMAERGWHVELCLLQPDVTEPRQAPLSRSTRALRTAPMPLPAG
jgi:hypothetical protein